MTQAQPERNEACRTQAELPAGFTARCFWRLTAPPPSAWGRPREETCEITVKAGPAERSDKSCPDVAILQARGADAHALATVKLNRTLNKLRGQLEALGREGRHLRAASVILQPQDFEPVAARWYQSRPTPETLALPNQAVTIRADYGVVSARLCTWDVARAWCGLRAALSGSLEYQCYDCHARAQRCHCYVLVNTRAYVEGTGKTWLRAALAAETQVYRIASSKKLPDCFRIGLSAPTIYG